MAMKIQVFDGSLAEPPQGHISVTPSEQDRLSVSEIRNSRASTQILLVKYHQKYPPVSMSVESLEPYFCNRPSVKAS